ncbi:MAG: hypothetical protein IPM97_05560 [Bdellovibrionaceae bacterium]|nr:hypothetical protein [Pseudobdellovibrionaceae bacterium]
MAKLNEQVTCPHCHKNFTLSEVISRDLELETERRLEIKYKTKEDAQKLKIQNMENERLDFERQKEKELLEQRKALETDLSRKMEQKFKTENQDLKNQIEEERQKSLDAQQREVDLRKQQRELEAKTKQLNLEMERRLDDERARLSDQIKKQADEESSLKIAAKDKQLNDMKKS